MVCIIDDREDVWTFAPNLVHVKPYIFFKNTGDINDPHGVLAEAKKDDPEVPGPERRLERRQSIDMPSIDDSETKAKSDETKGKSEDTKEDPENSDKKEIKDDVSMVSDDLELSDDDSNDATKPAKKEEKAVSEDTQVSFWIFPRYL